MRIWGWGGEVRARFPLSASGTVRQPGRNHLAPAAVLNAAVASVFASLALQVLACCSGLRQSGTLFGACRCDAADCSHPHASNPKVVPGPG